MRKGQLAAAALRHNRPIFQRADWLWGKIPSSPTLDASSSAMVSALSAGGTQHICGLVDYGVAINGPDGITVNTPRYDIDFAYEGEWGPDPFPLDMPIPDGIILPSGSDGHMVTADPATNLVYGLWQADDGPPWSASWGGITNYNHDGIDWSPTNSTGCGLSRYAGVIRVSEIAAGFIPHALFFSTDIAAGTFRYPAYKSDGWNAASSANPIPEGARLQLDPTINLSAISGITAAEITIGRALQTYGAYCGDNGGARMGFLFELAPDAYSSAPGSVYLAKGLEWDYFDLSHIPWSSLRVLANWHGG